VKQAAITVRDSMEALIFSDIKEVLSSNEGGGGLGGGIYPGLPSVTMI
jgi:hypothetical protein